MGNCCSTNPRQKKKEEQTGKNLIQTPKTYNTQNLLEDNDLIYKIQNNIESLDDTKKIYNNNIQNINI